MASMKHHYDHRIREIAIEQEKMEKTLDLLRKDPLKKSELSVLLEKYNKLTWDICVILDELDHR